MPKNKRQKNAKTWLAYTVPEFTLPEQASGTERAVLSQKMHASVALTVAEDSSADEQVSAPFYNPGLPSDHWRHHWSMFVEATTHHKNTNQIWEQLSKLLPAYKELEQELRIALYDARLHLLMGAGSLTIHVSSENEILIAVKSRPDLTKKAQELTAKVETWAEKFHMNCPTFRRIAWDSLWEWTRGRKQPPVPTTPMLSISLTFDLLEKVKLNWQTDGWQFWNEHFEIFADRKRKEFDAFLRSYRKDIEELAAKEGYRKTVRKRAGLGDRFFHYWIFARYRCLNESKEALQEELETERKAGNREASLYDITTSVANLLGVERKRTRVIAG